MHTLILAVALAGLPTELTPSTDAQVTTQMPSQRGRIALSVSLLGAGWATSIVNTSVAYATCQAYLSCFSYTTVWPIGVAVSSLPIVGPAVGIVSDVVFQAEEQGRPGHDFIGRTIVNAASLVMQVSGLVLLITTPRAPRKQRLTVTSFGAAPVREGATIGVGGTFDF